MQTDILRGSFTFKYKVKGTNSKDPIHEEIVRYSFYSTGPTQNSFPPFVNRHRLCKQHYISTGEWEIQGCNGSQYQYYYLEEHDDM